MVFWAVLILSSYLTVVREQIRNNAPDPLLVSVDWHIWAIIAISVTSLIGSPLLLGKQAERELDPEVLEKVANILRENPATLRASSVGALYAHMDIRDADIRDMFQGDEVENTAYVDPAKVQMLLVTLFALFVYAAAVKVMLSKVVTGMLPATSDGFVALLAISHAAYLLSKVAILKRQKAAKEQAKIENAEISAREQPEKAKSAWNLASVRLDAYFRRNLAQINQIVVISILVMIVGFGFVLWGVILSSHQPKLTPTSWVAGIAGIVTQFIGATFMVIYRSTMTQANQFMHILDRINTIGIAVQVLDSIPDAETQLKNETRSQIVALLLSPNVSPQAPARRGQKQARTAKTST